ncbi:MAG: heterodisulfide reductase-related iron-sulfur binding cluster [Pelovirga sp.]
MTSTASPTSALAPVASCSNAHLRLTLENIDSACSACGICVQECAYLQRYGNPQEQARGYDPEDPELLVRPFACNLCGLCTAVCPDGIDPAAMFLQLRRAGFLRGLSALPEHRGLRRFERIGSSKLFSWYALPQGCDTIFFPGCALAGSRAETTWKTFEQLRQQLPAVGIVLDCCTKPSHDLGDQVHFLNMFNDMKNYLIEHGVKNVLVACPNCAQVFRDYATELTTRTVYEVLKGIPLPHAPNRQTALTVHDPCVSRYDVAAQLAVRKLLRGRGFRIEEMTHSGTQTLCCGKGGGSGCLAEGSGEGWVERRLAEAHGRPIVSYCAACCNSYASRTVSSHVLDLLFAPHAALPPAQRITRGPLSYLARLRLKRRIQQQVCAAASRERVGIQAGIQSERTPARRGTRAGRLLGLLVALVPGLRGGRNRGDVQPQQ